jgi:hypothetical protein
MRVHSYAVETKTPNDDIHLEETTYTYSKWRQFLATGQVRLGEGFSNFVRPPAKSSRVDCTILCVFDVQRDATDRRIAREIAPSLASSCVYWNMADTCAFIQRLVERQADVPVLLCDNKSTLVYLQRGVLCFRYEIDVVDISAQKRDAALRIAGSRILTSV